mmetsp:Transcript_10282/g.27443  ORF Transcript_10282/g.27443 Transcript_10282/m.27443 type:complete len:224 (-) Transcript_10282:188-859(-)
MGRGHPDHEARGALRAPLQVPLRLRSEREPAEDPGRRDPGFRRGALQMAGAAQGAGRDEPGRALGVRREEEGGGHRRLPEARLRGGRRGVLGGCQVHHPRHEGGGHGRSPRGPRQACRGVRSGGQGGRVQGGDEARRRRQGRGGERGGAGPLRRRPRARDRPAEQLRHVPPQEQRAGLGQVRVHQGAVDRARQREGALPKGPGEAHGPGLRRREGRRRQGSGA